MSRKTIVSSFIILGLSLTACSAPPNVPQNGNNVGQSESISNPGAVVTISNDSFEPSVVTINVGQSVEWQWQDAGNPHNVTFTNGEHSPSIASGSWVYKFNNVGTFHYSDTLHFHVQGEVIVKQ